MKIQKCSSIAKLVRTILLLLVSCMTAVSHEGMNMVKNRPDQTDLQVRISCDKEKIHKAETVVLKVELVNVSDDRLSLFGQLLWGYGGGLIIHVTDDSGKTISAERMDDDMIVPSVLGDQTSYVVLMPGHYLGITRIETVANLFGNSGVFSVSVEYRSPVPKRYAKTPNFWGREQPSIKSLPILVQVVD